MKRHASLFLPADILLPSGGVDCAKWAVIACDQFTSQPEYWREAERIVGDSPSALEIIYPEAYLLAGRCAHSAHPGGHDTRP